MLGGKNRKPLGYTIIEVMIVLAVSGVMFLIAANFINGKQQKTAFTQGVNEMASRIQDTIEQVTDGQYSDIPFNCAAGMPLSITGTGGGGSTQGTNLDCVFIGKLLQFYNNSDPSSYEIFSLAADRASTSLDGSVTPVISNSGLVDLTIQQSIPQSLQVTSTKVTVTDTTGTTHTTYGFGFAQSQGTAGVVPGTYASGAQTINLIYAPGLSSATNESGAVTAITGNVALAQNVTLCLTDGSNARYAQILIGDSTNNSSQLNVSIKMNGSTPC